ncbi:T9SS type A sorting domain-containing protein [Thioalkalivibrio sp.]|uniref:T9SS type A sorting domain-containing protein n=1 Tax=Thioalkalivibrio sp. TaxID=2093813 RepID=UPI003974C3A5
MPEVADTGCVNLVVTATDLSGAAATDTFQLCVADSPPVNVGDFDEGQFGVNLYPNPTQGEVTVDIDAPDLGEVGLSVFGINGKQILRRSYGATDRIIFDMSDHVSGMYFVKIDVDGTQVLKKLILKRY